MMRKLSETLQGEKVSTLPAAASFGNSLNNTAHGDNGGATGVNQSSAFRKIEKTLSGGF